MFLPVLPSTLRLPSSSNNDFAVVVDKTKNVSMLNLDFLPYLLIAGTLIFIIVILIQNIKLYRYIFGVCWLIDEIQFQNILTRCKHSLYIWFNPLAYIARYNIDRFCELSCGESVVTSMNNEERRMNMIMKTEGLKSKKWVRMFAVAMILALALTRNSCSICSRRYFSHGY